jgi:hypothetical protein
LWRLRCADPGIALHRAFIGPKFREFTFHALG